MSSATATSCISASTSRAALPPGCVEACRGCRHRLLDPIESARIKRERLVEALREVCPGERVAPITPREGSGYRERITLHAEFGGGRWRLGTMGPIRTGSRKRERELVEIPDCPVHSSRANRILGELARMLPPDPALRLAFVVLSGALATLVLKSRDVPGTGWIDREALAEAGLEGLFVHLNPSAGNRVIAGAGMIRVFGNESSRDAAGVLHGPRSFRQAEPAVHGSALREAAEFLAPSAELPVLDLYSGLGEGLRLWTSLGAQALGVELNSEAVAFAARNAPMAMILRGRCGDRVPQIREWLGEAGRAAAYLNPPRSGAEARILDLLAGEPAVSRIAYLSCSPGTLARDLHELETSGFRVARIHPYDFFPRTDHVEALALLERVSS